MKITLIYLFGFGLGAFMLFNSAETFYRFIADVPWTITPFEKMFSSVMTGLVGTVLILYTYLLIRKPSRKN